MSACPVQAMGLERDPNQKYADWCTNNYKNQADETDRQYFEQIEAIETLGLDSAEAKELVESAHANQNWKQLENLGLKKAARAQGWNKSSWNKSIGT